MHEEEGRPGRPRSAQAHQAILQAARDLLTDDGIPGLSIDAIASRAGVSKNTIYRRWPNKAAIVMDAFTDATQPALEPPHEGTADQRLRGQVHRVARLMNEPEARRPFVALVAASQHDHELAQALRERFIDTRRTTALRLVRDYQQASPDANHADPDTLIDLIYGALYYRLLISGDSLDESAVDRLLDAVLGSINSR